MGDHEDLCHVRLTRAGALLAALLLTACGDHANATAPPVPAAPRTTATPDATATAASPTAAAPGTPAHAVRHWLDRDQLRVAVADIARRTGAEVGVAVRPLDGGGAFTAGPLQEGAAWSTMKVPVVLARLRLAAAAGDPASAYDGLAVRAITASDNASAETLFRQIEAAKGGLAQASAYVQELLRESGDRRTTVNTTVPAGGYSTFGQTVWSLAQGTRFYRALANGCLAPRSAARRVTDLMGEVEPSQRWGLGRARFAAATRVLSKGGWGPNRAGRYLVRQFGIVRGPGLRGAVVGLIATPASGSFAAGVDALDALGAAVAGALHVSRSPTAARCESATVPL